MWFAAGWLCWHWGLLFLGLLPRSIGIPLMNGALVIDALCVMYFFYWSWNFIQGRVERVRTPVDPKA